MIPAILSFIFVIYLYHSLNKDLEANGRQDAGHPDQSAATAGTVSGQQVEDLVARLQALDQRLQKLK